MKKQLILFCLFILVIPISYSFDFEYFLNNSQLPFSRQDYALISLPSQITLNNSLLIHYGQFLSGSNNIFLNETSYNLTINTNIPLNILPNTYLTHTNISYFDNLTNATLWANFTFNYNIFNDTKNFTPFFFIDEFRFGYELCDYQMQNRIYQTFYETTVQSDKNSTIRVVCSSSSFAKCPNQIFTENSVTLVHLNISIPANISFGHYTDVIYFYQDKVINNNQTYDFTIPIIDNLTLEYNIKDCILPIPSTEACVFTCNASNIDEFLDCKLKEVQCQLDIYNALIEANKTRQVNNTIIQNNTIEKPVLTYDPNLTDALNKWYADVKTITDLNVEDRRKANQIVDLTKERDILFQEKSSIQSQLPLLVRQSVFDLLMQNQNLSMQLRDMNSKTISNITFFIVLGIIILGSLVYGFIWWYEKTHPY